MISAILSTRLAVLFDMSSILSLLASNIFGDIDVALTVTVVKEGKDFLFLWLLKCFLLTEIITSIRPNSMKAKNIKIMQIRSHSSIAVTVFAKEK